MGPPVWMGWADSQPNGSFLSTFRLCGEGLSKGGEVAAAIRQVVGGCTCITPALQDHIGARGVTKLLMPREIETVDLTRLGLSNKEIGRIPSVSKFTAKFHVKAILVKLEITDRAEAAAAYERGLLQVD